MFDSSLTLAERVRYAQMDVGHFTYEVLSAGRDAGRSRWQYTRTTVIGGIVSLTVGVAGLTWNAFEPWRYGVAENQGGVLIAVIGFFGVLYALASVHDETGSWRSAPKRLADGHDELVDARARLAEAEDRIEREAAEKQRLRQLPAALDTLALHMSTSSRDWSRNAGDARIYAIIVGWSDDEDEDGAWAELAERHHWTPKYVATLKANHEAYAYALKQEARRRA